MSALPSDAPLIPTQPVAPALMPEYEPSYDDLVTEDHKPVDSIFIWKLCALLTHALNASWAGPGLGRTFLVLSNVGWFYREKTPAVVPDCLLSLDVTFPEDLHVKQGHSYYQWQMGKPPDVIIEVVSDRTGGEESFKKALYARQGVAYYVVLDPKHVLSGDTLRTYELSGSRYRLADAGPWEDVGLGLRLWQGTFEGVEDTWLRWCDANGVLIPTAEEQAAQSAERARQADERASKAAEDARQAKEHATQADERIRELEAELRRLKGEPPSGAR